MCPLLDLLAYIIFIEFKPRHVTTITQKYMQGLSQEAQLSRLSFQYRCVEREKRRKKGRKGERKKRKKEEEGGRKRRRGKGRKGEGKGERERLSQALMAAASSKERSEELIQTVLSMKELSYLPLSSKFLMTEQSELNYIIYGKQKTMFLLVHMFDIGIP